MNLKKTVGGAILAGSLFVASVAGAAVTFDPDTGYGFVGKGDVQLVYGWNNKGLQENANRVQFRVASESETTWECYNSSNNKIQERMRTTTLQGVFSSEARERNQFTGFNLLGWDGSVTNETSGPPLNDCPGGPWSYVESSTQTVETGGGLQVSNNGTDWSALQ